MLGDGPVHVAAGFLDLQEAGACRGAWNVASNDQAQRKGTHVEIGVEKMDLPAAASIGEVEGAMSPSAMNSTEPRCSKVVAVDALTSAATRRYETKQYDAFPTKSTSPFRLELEWC